jgi:hypothetical protein
MVLRSSPWGVAPKVPKLLLLLPSHRGPAFLEEGGVEAANHALLKLGAFASGDVGSQ